MIIKKKILVALVLLITLQIAKAQQKKVSVIGEGWAGTSINTVVFRKNALVSFKEWQFAAYYDTAGHVVLSKRNLRSGNWVTKQTSFTGNIRDAHNSISIMADGDGYLHMSWDHHGTHLKYCQSKEPLSLEMDTMRAMTGLNETKVTYPEFYKLSTGDLLFLYRDGASGKGNLVLNRYFTKTKKWQQVQNNLIDGENKRNAYWQACTDNKGAFHISWVWRESSDVATNHDMCYAKTEDGGKTWLRSDKTIYALPINATNAEYIALIPQKSELINQTAMCADDAGRAYIASYWKKESGNPQYQLLFYNGKRWMQQQVSARKATFSLSGTGTKKIPIARPQLLVHGKKAFYFFRDEERGNKVSVFINDDLEKGKWRVTDIAGENVGQWEPLLDSELWKNKKQLHLFVQHTGQGDGEKLSDTKSQPIKVIEWKY
jgi:hypothetical protein